MWNLSGTRMRQSGELFWATLVHPCLGLLVPTGTCNFFAAPPIALNMWGCSEQCQLWPLLSGDGAVLS